MTKILSRDRRTTIKKSPLIFIFLDFDGTVCPLNPQNPFAVQIDPAAKKAMQRLARIPNVILVILTGRDIPTVQRLVGIPGTIYVGNHGMGQTRVFPAKPEDIIYVPEALPFVEGTKKLVTLAQRSLDPTIVLEPKGISLALNIGAFTDQRTAYEQVNNLLAKPALELGFRETWDVTTVEYIPNVADRDKGSALKSIVEGHIDQGHKPFVLFAGDALTDISALQAAKNLGGLAVVAERPDTKQSVIEAANMRVPGVSGVAELLKEMADLLS